MKLSYISRKIIESKYDKFQGYEIEVDNRGYHSGQTDFHVNLYDFGEVVAYADYTEYQGEVTIKHIESLVKGKGYGSKIMEYLASAYGYENLERTSLTPSGAKMRKKLDKKFNFDYSAHKASQNKHIPISRIDDVRDYNLRNFLLTIINDDYSAAWDELIENPNFSNLRTKYDLNNIAEIAEWVQNSTTNRNDPTDDPPPWVQELLNDIT